MNKFFDYPDFDNDKNKEKNKKYKNYHHFFWLIIIVIIVILIILYFVFFNKNCGSLDDFRKRDYKNLLTFESDDYMINY